MCYFRKGTLSSCPIFAPVFGLSSLILKYFSSQKSKCTLPALDLSTCQAAYEVEVNDRVRKSIGIAAYNEYVKEMEDKHGKEEADRLINVPKENLKNLQALQTVVRFGSGQHPKGSTPDESWSVTDYNRLNMGEEEYKAHRLIVAAEFGGEKAAKVLGEETDLMINDAIKRISAINA